MNRINPPQERTEQAINECLADLMLVLNDPDIVEVHFNLERTGPDSATVRLTTIPINKIN